MCWLAFCGVLLAGWPIKMMIGEKDGQFNLKGIRLTNSSDTRHNQEGAREDSELVEDLRRLTEADREGGGRTVTDSQTRIFRVTAYCACEKCCGRWATVLVSSGKRCTASGYCLKADGSDAFRICAAGPELRFGTKIEIENLGRVVVEDRGGAITGNRLDIYTGHDPGAHRRAIEFGVKYLQGRIVEP